MSFPRYSQPFAFMHVMLLYRLFFQPLGGGKNPDPTRMGCRAEHTEIYYKQTGPLTAFFPFIYLKERKSMIKAIAQLASQGTSQQRMEQFPHVTPTIRKLGRELGGPTPLWTAAPKIYAHTTDGLWVQHLRSSFHLQPLGASSGFCICTPARIQ